MGNQLLLDLSIGLPALIFFSSFGFDSQFRTYKTPCGIPPLGLRNYRGDHFDGWMVKFLGSSSHVNGWWVVILEISTNPENSGLPLSVRHSFCLCDHIPLTAAFECFSNLCNISDCPAVVTSYEQQHPLSGFHSVVYFWALTFCVGHPCSLFHHKPSELPFPSL